MVGSRWMPLAGLLCIVWLATLGAESSPAKSKLPKLFDFGYFKRTFSKRYGSLAEELARRKYFLPRTFRAFVTAIKYKYGQTNHFLAISEISDFSPAELEMMYANKAEVARELRRQQIAQAARKPGSAAQAAAKLDAAPQAAPRVPELDMSDQQVVERLEELAREHRDEPAFEQLLGTSKEEAAARKKRSLSGGGGGGAEVQAGASSAKRRHLQLDDLVKGARGASELQAELAQQRVELHAPSNNPNYRQRDLASRGLDDQQESLSWFRVKGANEQEVEWPEHFMRELRGYLKQPDGVSKVRAMEDQIAELNAMDQVLPDDEQQAIGPDGLWVDHRGQCMSMPRAQGKCGSCYAFAITALLEWIYCKRTGSLTPFSEQYFLDCGPYSGLAGCEGGDRLQAIEFIHNFGAELRVSYPYRQRQNECPYPRSTDLKTTGYIRPNLGAAVVVPRRKWASYVKYTPIMVTIFVNDDFAEYGGGVHLLNDCNKDNGHAMLLVGHGREEGQQFWLIRNSHSVGWGEKGYYKLAKRSDPNCIFMEGYTIGTANGVKIEARPEVNKRNSGQYILRHNEKLMKSQLADI